MIAELFSLEGRVALVTGGNGGLGRAVALGFQAAGAKVAITGRNPAKNEAVAAELGPEAAVFSLDVRHEDGVARTVNGVVERFGKLDILVNNAGNFLRVGSVADLPREVWDEVIETHLTGSFLCAKYAVRAMLAQGGGGKIINIGSMYSVFGTHNYVDYPTAKAGVGGLTRALAVELGPNNIQVNAILPGWFPTEMSGDLPTGPVGDIIRGKTPAGRWGDPRELVGAAIFLASHASDFVTGVQLPVDGGYLVMDRPRLE